MIRIFIGYDKRQPLAVQVLTHSLYTRATTPISITPLVLSQLPIKRKGLTEFTYSRYIVPHICNYDGFSIFMDADMLCLTDITEIMDFVDIAESVSVVKGGTRFEWPSLMVFNNRLCKRLTPNLIENGTPQDLKWADSVGSLPPEWNHCVGYDEPKAAKIVHYTQGIPFWPETKNCEYSKEWWDEANKSMSSVSFMELMGNSIHRQRMGL